MEGVVPLSNWLFNGIIEEMPKTLKESGDSSFFNNVYRNTM